MPIASRSICSSNNVTASRCHNGVRNNQWCSAAITDGTQPDWFHLGQSSFLAQQVHLQPEECIQRVDLQAAVNWRRCTFGRSMSPSLALPADNHDAETESSSYRLVGGRMSDFHASLARKAKSQQLERAYAHRDCKIATNWHSRNSWVPQFLNTPHAGGESYAQSTELAEAARDHHRHHDDGARRSGTTRPARGRSRRTQSLTDIVVPVAPPDSDVALT